jgi:hypothetical protein
LGYLSICIPAATVGKKFFHSGLVFKCKYDIKPMMIMKAVATKLVLNDLFALMKYMAKRMKIRFKPKATPFLVPTSTNARNVNPMRTAEVRMRPLLFEFRNNSYEINPQHIANNAIP